jgi:hypothetical protein
MSVAAHQLFRRAGELLKCAYCDRQLHVTTARNDLRATRDHVHPRHLGGTTCVWSCIACNQLKGGLTLAAWQDFMADNPRWWTQFAPKQKRRKRLGPKKRSPVEAASAKAKSVAPKPAPKRAPPPARGPAQAAHADASAGPPEGASAGPAPARRGKPRVWIRRRKPQAIAAPQAPIENVTPPTPIAIDAVPSPAKPTRFWIRRKARALMAPQQRSEA